MSRGADVHLRSGPQMREYEAIVAQISRETAGPVLDWGAGFGQVSALLAAAGVDVSSYEYSPGATDGLRRFERYPDLPLRVGGDPVALPYADGAFEAVLSCGVLEHVPDPDGSLREIRRVLRPGGRLYVFKLPNRYSYLELIARLAGLYYHGKLPHDRVYTLRTATELVERNGYRVVEARLANMLPLALPGRLFSRLAPVTWRLSRGLSRIPLVRLAATDLELVARRP